MILTPKSIGESQVVDDVTDQSPLLSANEKNPGSNKQNQNRSPGSWICDLQIYFLYVYMI